MNVITSSIRSKERFAVCSQLKTVISTWYVADDAENATFFPQIGRSSDTAEAKLIYWRCVLCFFASSIAVNPQSTHVFFTNTTLPIIDGLDVSQILNQWRVKVVYLPITYRLPVGRVQRWGNQFYILDVIRHLAEYGRHERYVILDADCVWIRPVSALERAIDRYGVLTYILGEREYGTTDLINGLSRQGMARFLGSVGGKPHDAIAYCGGEIFAAKQKEIDKLAGQIDAIWSRVLAAEQDTPKEEAHLLSILYAMHGYEIGTANLFIKRIWTNLKHNNVEISDLDLTIWHLPAEKRTGFHDLFLKLKAAQSDYRDPLILGFRPDAYKLAMGIPRRNSSKLVRDLALKLRERVFG